MGPYHLLLPIAGLLELDLAGERGANSIRNTPARTKTEHSHVDAYRTTAQEECGFFGGAPTQPLAAQYRKRTYG